MPEKDLRLAPWLERGVLLQVIASSGDFQPIASRVRDSVKAAISRGAMMAGTRPSVGETWAQELPDPAVDSALKERNRLTRDSRVLNAFVAPAAVLAFAVLLTKVSGDFPLQRDASGTYIAQAWLVVVLFLAVPFGFFISAPLIKILASTWPTVWVRDSSYTWRLTRGVSAKVISLVAAGVAGYLLLKAGIKKE